MLFARVTHRLGVVACLAVLLTGCYPPERSTAEESHPLIETAVARKSTSPREAAKLLDQALAENPRLARAHWELGLICLNNTSNYAAAVYHFQKVLELRPDWPHASTTRQLISNAKLELVKEGVEAPTLPSVQRQMDRLVGELHRLTEQNTNLATRVQYLSGVTQQLAAENLNLHQRLLALNQTAPPTVSPLPSASPPSDSASLTTRQGFAPRAPRPGGSPSAASLSPRSGVPTTGPARPLPASAARTYTVQRGETGFAIARRHGLSVRDLVAANPGLDPARLKAGQRLNLAAR